MTELVGRLYGDDAGVRMRGVCERLTWPARKLAWKIEERLIWPLGDVLRRGPKTPGIESASGAPETIEIAPELLAGPTGWPASSGAETEAGAPAVASKKFRTPFGGRIDTSLRETAVVLGTVAVAIAVGVGVATLLGHSDSAQKSSSAGARPASDRQVSAAAPAASGPATLHGVTPDFKTTPGSQAAAGATATTAAQAAPLANTNSKPSSIPPGVADNIAALRTARTFSGAFVLYEIGKTDAQVRATFRSTATPQLAGALQDRPPRLPDSVDVPTAKVQNIVLGTEKGNQLDASVSLLRLGETSELRLTLIRKKGAWAVSEVRG